MLSDSSCQTWGSLSHGSGFHRGLGPQSLAHPRPLGLGHHLRGAPTKPPEIRSSPGPGVSENRTSLTACGFKEIKYKQNPRKRERNELLTSEVLLSPPQMTCDFETCTRLLSQDAAHGLVRAREPRAVTLEQRAPTAQLASSEHSEGLSMLT